MQDGNFSVDGLRGLTSVGFTQFAVDVVARVAARDGVARVALKEPLVVAMLAAAKSPDPAALANLLPDFRRARVSKDVLADCYIPEVARRLGRGWEDDEVSFAQVSIGSSRLQSLLRDIGACWSADGTEAQSGNTALLIVPGREQHTLGALTVSGWLRRQGISVCVRVAPSTDEIEAILAQRHFDGALISVACRETLEVCTGLVKTIKQATSNRLPIALGGAVLERGGEVVTVSGVDIVTNDLAKAVLALGLTCKRPLSTAKT
ncbi:MAG: hypothetical protein U0934_03555 [Pseudotabrizicola sp.]|uniref:cobalamin B12-binding domain-containing protein n=1 Tax=Pseudotabrizicola sp. TaxID=2939647 RepID=UPI0027210861|nr:hypothetical protein [Pseudotabrizicola sp.]MDO8881693.1 hypothetical protein [Pseudotabrizicola sp.]MDP2081506.1 hypothetical protein [Pseudotabrizicola sp.]MDZ7573019.1 hypothetical protein [Pseudotabrizicola sp.]